MVLLHSMEIQLPYRRPLIVWFFLEKINRQCIHRLRQWSDRNKYTLPKPKMNGMEINKFHSHHYTAQPIVFGWQVKKDAKHAKIVCVCIFWCVLFYTANATATLIKYFHLSHCHCSLLCVVGLVAVIIIVFQFAKTSGRSLFLFRFEFQ